MNFLNTTLTQKALVCAVIILCFTTSCDKRDGNTNTSFTVEKFDPVQVAKTNPMKVYVHYMPWFFSKEYDGNWGGHWTMANKNPDEVVNGKANIAAHIYPEIGPYSSNDPDVLEYHSLLIKYSGFDGVLFDWYGTQSIYDYPQILEATNNARNKISLSGIEYAVVYEDRTLEANAANDTVLQRQLAQSDFEYLKNIYFKDKNYIHVNGAPLTGVFGPIIIEDGEVWSRVFNGAKTDPTFITLWGEGNDGGDETDGEFGWIWNGGSNHFQLVSSFYDKPNVNFKMGIAYPGFDDYYQEGGWGSGLGWEIDPENGATLKSLLDLAIEKNITHLQVATWNDFGEATSIEPSLEYGSSYLEQIQSFTGVDYGKSELDLVKDLYNKRKRFKNNIQTQMKLDQVYYYLISLQVSKASELLQEIN